MKTFDKQIAEILHTGEQNLESAQNLSKDQCERFVHLYIDTIS